MTKAREIAELGQKLTVDASGNLEFAGNLKLGDNNKAIFGAGSDLQIYHDGSNSIIKDAGTGNLVIGADTLPTLATLRERQPLQGLMQAAHKYSTTTTHRNSPPPPQVSQSQATLHSLIMVKPSLVQGLTYRFTTMVLIVILMM